MAVLGISDVFRTLNGNLKAFTWQKPNHLQRSRLDYFLVSNSMLNTITSVDHLNFIKSDHRPIKLKFKLNKFIPGKPQWKHPDRLLNDIGYARHIKKCIGTTLGKYVIVPGFNDFYTECTKNELIDFLSLKSGSPFK